jgi:hypothetical protein
MKKKYSTPDVVFESFTLSNTIAGSCEVKTDTQSQGNCGYPMPGAGWVFITGMTGCGVGITDEMSLALNGFCYHVPAENQSLFNS